MNLSFEVTDKEFSTLVKALDSYKDAIISYSSDYDKNNLNERVKREREAIESLKKKIVRPVGSALGPLEEAKLIRRKGSHYENKYGKRKGTGKWQE